MIFFKQEMKLINEYSKRDSSKELLEDYLEDNINKENQLENDLKDYIARNTSLTVSEYQKSKTLLNKLVKEEIKPFLKEEVEDLLAKTKSASSSSAAAISGSGRIKRAKTKSKAKAKSKIMKSNQLEKPPTIPQTVPPTGLQPQQYIQPQVATHITPQLTQQLAQQVAEQIKAQSAAQLAVAPAATGSGQLTKPRGKAKAKWLLPSKEGTEITVIKPSKQHLDYI